MITEVDPVATVVLDSNGNGQISLGPPSGTKWAPRLATLAVSTSTKTPQGFLYRGSPSGPLQLIDQTYTGQAASSQKIAGAIYYPGQLIWAKWTGGDPGALATLQVFGQQGLKNDPFESALVGEGFAPNARTITLPTGAGATTARIVIGPDVPVPLNTYDFSHMLPSFVGPFKTVAAILWYVGTAGDSYQYMALVRNNPTTSAAIILGAVTGTTMVERSAGVPECTCFTFGAPTRANDNLFIQDGSILTVSDTSAVDILNTAQVLFQNTSTLELQSGTSLLLDVGSVFSIDGNSAPRGTVLFVASTVNVSGAVKTAYLVDPGSTVYRNGRAFRVTFGGVFNSTVANSTALIELDTGGNVLITGQSRLSAFQLAASQDEHKWISYFRNTSGSDQTTTVQLYMTPSAGTLTGVHAATYPFTLHIEDIGSSSSFPGLPSL